MNKEDQNDQLVDMLLRELVGNETPPDVREQVMAALEEDQQGPKLLVPSAESVQQTTLRRKKTSKIPIFALAALLMLSAVFLGLFHVEGIKNERLATLTEVHGTVSLPLGELAAGQTLTTAADSTAEITFSDGTVVQLEPRTSVRVPRQKFLDRSKSLELVIGGVSAEVAPQGQGYPMTFAAGHAKAVVVGTALAFYTNEESTRLEVTKGLVRLEPTSGIEPVDVAAGGFAEADDSEGVNVGLINPPVVAQVPDPPMPVAPVESVEPRKPAELPKSPKPVSRAVVVGFVLMDADTDLPVSEEVLENGALISLSSLSAPRISLRAEIEGDRPLGVRFEIIRVGGGGTGIRPITAQHHFPYYATGDYSGEKRSEDCRPWTPKPGRYRISATPIYKTSSGKVEGETYELELRFKR